MTAWVQRHRTPLAATAAVVAAGLAVLWLLVVPDAAREADGLRWMLLRFGHSLTWGLLALAALALALSAPAPAVRWPAYAALACYVAFLAALLA